jgi:hypothetical protein
MGLDAVVYKRLEEVRFAPGTNLDAVRVEDVTGEVYFDKDGGDLRREEVEAIHKRLGNMAMIAALHKEIARILASKVGHSILLDKVLYDGTHGGDFIPVEDLAALRWEISLVREKTKAGRSIDLDMFLESMQELVNVSDLQGNPIVFE